MNIRVRRAAVALLALTISLNASAVFAAPRERVERPGFVQQLVRRVKQVLNPVLSTFTNTDPTAFPGPPKP